MNFTEYDLGQLSGGEIVEVSLSGTEANVQLVDDTDLSNYRSGSSYHYFGGHYTRSPARIPVPRAGHWHVVVDLGGRVGTVRTSVRVIRPARVSSY
jgi:hypothetical protein